MENSQAASFIKRQPIKTFPKGQILIYQDETPDALYAVRSGFIKVTDISVSGNEQLLWLAKRYDVVPLEWLFGEQPHSQYFYTAHTDVEAFVVPRLEFMTFVQDDAAVLYEILRLMTRKYDLMLQHLNAAQKPKAREKIVYALSFLSKRFSLEERHGTNEVSLPITHQDIASLVGISRETAAIELKALKDEGVIDYNKKTFLIYASQLEKII